MVTNTPNYGGGFSFMQTPQPQDAWGQSAQFMGGGVNSQGYWNQGTQPTMPGIRGFNPTMPGIDSRMRSPEYVGQEAKYYADTFGNMIGGMQPAWQPYFQQSQALAGQATTDAANQYAGMAQQYGNQMTGQANAQWGSQLAGNPAYAQWQALLSQQAGEASGAAPQYLQDYWAKTANERLGSNMGAFAAPSSQFAANQFGRLNADAAQQYHTGAQQALGSTIAQGNSYFNPYMGNALSQAGSLYGQGMGYAQNAGNQAYGFGQGAYNNDAAMRQQLGQGLISKFMPSPIKI